MTQTYKELFPLEAIAKIAVLMDNDISFRVKCIVEPYETTLYDVVAEK